MKLLSTLRPDTRFGRPVALTSVFALLIASVPGAAIASAMKPVERFVASLDERAAPMPKSRLLTAAAMERAQGRSGENPYLSGQSKWDTIYKGVNLMTGDFSISGTDLTFEGGYGIPVNVTRSYSANNIDEGPLGKGWTLSVDMRSTAGGLIKSAGAPVRAVPTALKERPSMQLGDPNAELATGLKAQPAEAVLATDAGGTEETIQVDADGVLTTPPWDKNTNETEYEHETKPDGSVVRRMVRNKTFTPDGTVYVYERKGTYPGGTKPWNQPNATPEHSDVMKIVSATDRQGNVTTYSYGADVTFQKANGTVVEKRLANIQMPNGHQITFGWSGNRIATASDGVRTVQYGYTNGLLTSVTTPGGKTTTYGHGGSDAGPGWEGAVAGGLITSITDPRGFATQIYYRTNEVFIGPYAAPSGSGVQVLTLRYPNGCWTAFGYGHGYRDAGGGFTGIYAVAEEQPASTWNGPREGNNAATVALQRTSVSLLGDMGNGLGPFMSIRLNNNFYGYTLGDIHRQYDLHSQNLSLETNYTFRGGLHPGGYNDWELARGRKLMDPAGPFVGVHVSRTETETGYNFMGNPLAKQVREYPDGGYSTYSGPPTRTATIGYAYWGADKYWQQKAVRDQSGRFSYTDYYPSTAPMGARGQTSKMYSSAHTTFNGASGTGNAWKYSIAPAADTHAARFEYDVKGRPTDAWKLQKTTTNPWTYVQTRTVYGSDGDGSWGQASSATEDFGGIGRTTSTLHYDSIGRADKVQDAKGQIFETNYDLDGVIQSVEKITNGVASPVVSYTYGSSGLTNGQVLSVKDELSGVEQSFTYIPSGGGKGQVASVTESGGPNPAYSSAYTYHESGDRKTSTYTSPEATTRWGYTDYTAVGDPASPSRAFQTMVRLDAGGSPTAEEFHYVYDSRGALREAAFAQAPDPTYTPGSGGSYYGAPLQVRLATNRARAHYEYDGGRLKLISHWWDAGNGGSYSSTPILANVCDYEVTNLNRGLKTESRFYRGFNLERTETYGYDAQNDQLTGANYGDGGANQVQTWGYDAAGNRISDSSIPGNWTYDNLNRILTSPERQYSHDILGNRTNQFRLQQGIGPSFHSHDWDVLGRMTAMNTPVLSGSPGVPRQIFDYRADGMRVGKTKGYINPAGGAYVPTGRDLYRYDGQMPVETIETEGSTTTVQRNALGARGTDMIERKVGTGATQWRFPLYDAHGNSVGTLGRPLTPTGPPTLGDERSYDAWGRVRLGGQTGAPSARYCASLGHVQDDESGLVYMRARYYEPGTGRFVSEDTARHGGNWFVYCGNNPVSRVDKSGKEFNDVSYYTVLGGGGLFAIGFMQMVFAALAAVNAKTPREVWHAAKLAAAGIALSGLGATIMGSLGTVPAEWTIGGALSGFYAAGAVGAVIFPQLVQMMLSVAIGGKTLARNAVVGVAIYSMVIQSYILAIDYDTGT